MPIKERPLLPRSRVRDLKQFSSCLNTYLSELKDKYGFVVFVGDCGLEVYSVRENMPPGYDWCGLLDVSNRGKLKLEVALTVSDEVNDAA